jgi:acyl-CoA thioesterase FadM
MTRHMEVDYLRPAPIDTPLTLTARHLRREGRKLFHTAELILPDGTPLARAKALFVVLDPALLQARAGAARNPA